MNDLEGITGFKSEKTDSAANTCSTALVTALINLTGHVKQVEEQKTKLQFIVFFLSFSRL